MGPNRKRSAPCLFGLNLNRKYWPMPPAGGACLALVVLPGAPCLRRHPSRGTHAKRDRGENHSITVRQIVASAAWRALILAAPCVGQGGVPCKPSPADGVK